MIPLSVPNVCGNELKYVTDAVTTGWVSTGGAYVDKFEEEISKYLNPNGAVSCQNGTAGLHISLMLMGVTKGDEVLVPALTFIAAVNPIKYILAEPVFMDCDDSLCMDPIKLREFCENQCKFENSKLINKKTGRHIKAIMIVHVFGNMANMEEIMDIAEEFNLKVIEDATEAIGTYYTEGKYSGKFAGTIGHMGVYSFNGNKIITSGGGGMIVSNDSEILKLAKHLTTQAKADQVYFIHDMIGYNYRMTNLQAAFGLAQLEQLEKFIRTKKENYFLYKSLFEERDDLKILNFSDKIRPNYWFYSLFLEDSYSLNRDELINKLTENNIQSRPIWGLICDQKPYLNSQKYDISKASYYYQRVVNIPCSSDLKKEEVTEVSKVILESVHS